MSRTFTTAGEYTGTVAVKDDEGTVTTKAVTVAEVTGTGRAPEIVEAVADRTTGPAPLDVLFQAVGADPDGDALTYKWEFGDQGTAFGAEAEHRYLTKGTYEAKLTVSDPAGNTDTATIAIVVSDPVGNGSPTVTAAAVPQDADRAAGRPVLGDGDRPRRRRADVPVVVRRRVGRRRRSPGTPRLHRQRRVHHDVTATDRAGNTDTDTIAITVGNPAGNQAPTVAAAADPASCNHHPWADDLRAAEAGAMSSGLFVDTVYGTSGEVARSKGGRLAVTTGTAGTEDLKVSIGQILLPKLPELAGMISTNIDKALGLIVDTEGKSTWEEIKKQLETDKGGAASLELMGALDRNVTVPIWDIDLSKR